MNEPRVTSSGNFSILVVCLGNLCRSPLAEHLLRQRLAEHLGAGAAGVVVSSAGVRARVGRGMDKFAEAELRRLGCDAGGFQARQFTPEQAFSAALVLTATRDLRSQILQEAPQALKRTFTLRELATLVASGRLSSDDDSGGAAALVARAAAWRGSARLGDYDVADPIGRSSDCHRAVADLIDRECTVIARALADAILSGQRPNDP